MSTIQITKAKDSEKKKDKRIKTITILLLIFFVILLLLSGYTFAKSIEATTINANATIAEPILVVETDGYSYHNEKTQQYQRDIKKDHILTLYEIPILRLSTVGSGEEEKLMKALQEI